MLTSPVPYRPPVIHLQHPAIRTQPNPPEHDPLTRHRILNRIPSPDHNISIGAPPLRYGSASALLSARPIQSYGRDNANQPNDHPTRQPHQHHAHTVDVPT